MNWSSIFEKYKNACYYMYKWITGEDYQIDISKFTERLFFSVLLEKGYLNNEERALEFFDAIFIICYVAPIGINRFKSYSESEYTTIICSDWRDRRSASIKTIENCFFLLEERETKLKED